MIAPVLVAILANPAVTELTRHLASLGIKVTEGNSGTFPEEQELYTKARSDSTPATAQRSGSPRTQNRPSRFSTSGAIRTPTLGLTF